MPLCRLPAPDGAGSRALTGIPPLALLGLNVAQLIEDAVKALVDLVVPDFGADWTSRLVTWLVAVPDVTGPAFPALNAYSRDLTAVGFGLLGATTVAGTLQLWAGGLAGAGRPGEAIRRAAIATGILISYPTLMRTLIVATNTLTAAMVRHPAVTDGLDKAFGEALIAGAITGGVGIGLAAGAAITLLYFVAALFVLKIGLTAALAVITLTGALVWGLYPLPHAEWLARAWSSTLVAAIAVPVTWACVFAAAALLASDTLVFDRAGQANAQLGPDLAAFVKPFAAVACFWLAYRAPGMLLAVARAGGLGLSGVGGGRGAGSGRGPETIVRHGVVKNADRFRALATRVAAPASAVHSRATRTSIRLSAAAPSPVRRAAAAPKRANDWWRRLPDDGRRTRPGPPGR